MSSEQDHQWCLGVWLDMDVAEQYNLAYNLWLEANGNKRYFSERGSGREITRGEFARLIVL